MQPKPEQECELREEPRPERKRHPRHLGAGRLLWDMMALIGIGTTLVMLARYVVIPILVLLKGAAG